MKMTDLVISGAPRHTRPMFHSSSTASLTSRDDVEGTQCDGERRAACAYSQLDASVITEKHL